MFVFSLLVLYAAFVIKVTDCQLPLRIFVLLIQRSFETRSCGPIHFRHPPLLRERSLYEALDELLLENGEPAGLVEQRQVESLRKLVQVRNVADHQ